MSQANATFEQVLAAVKANNGVVNDDHNNADKTRVLGGLVLLQRKGGAQFVAALLNNSYFCMNEVYLDKETGLPHLSTNSVGGNVVTADVDLATGVQNYNDKQLTNKFSNDFIVQFAAV